MYRPVKNTSDFERSVTGSKEEILLLINRNGSTLHFVVYLVEDRQFGHGTRQSHVPLAEVLKPI
jgi:hypothetical protein